MIKPKSSFRRYSLSCSPSARLQFPSCSLCCLPSPSPAALFPSVLIPALIPRWNCFTIGSSVEFRDETSPLCLPSSLLHQEACYRHKLNSALEKLVSSRVTATPAKYVVCLWVILRAVHAFLAFSAYNSLLSECKRCRKGSYGFPLVCGNKRNSRRVFLIDFRVCCVSLLSAAVTVAFNGLSFLLFLLISPIIAF